MNATTISAHKPAAQAARGSAHPFRSPTLSDLREWVRQSQPNARLTYAEGGPLAEVCRFELRDKVMELADRQWLTPHFVRGRGGEPDRHIVQRTHRKFVKGTEL